MTASVQSLSMVYTETKPRGPIFIDFSGPGPAYSLPSLVGTDNHDSRSNHSRAPAFSLGSRWKDTSSRNTNPGPIYSPRSSFREGVGPSLKGRHKERNPGASGPGPGAYQPNMAARSDNKTMPSYSIQGRHRSRRQADDTPGPNNYIPSFGSSEGKGFSLKGRYKDISSSDQTPGPGQYKPRSGFNRYGRMGAPETSIKGRHEKQVRVSSGPGPNMYNVNLDASSTNRTMPSWSLSSRSKDKESKDNSPGPQTYRPVPPSETLSAPAVSMKGRYKTRDSSDNTPGPNTYYPDPTISNKGRITKEGASLKGRYKERDPAKDNTPGPGAYGTISPRESGPATSIKGKWPAKSDADISPGPNTYLPTLNEHGPAYSLKGRYRDDNRGTAGPGPGSYNISKEMDPGPAYSMAGKWVAADTAKPGQGSPGPATYNYTEPWVKNDGGISFGVKHSRAKYETAVAKKPVAP